MDFILTFYSLWKVLFAVTYEFIHDEKRNHIHCRILNISWNKMSRYRIRGNAER